MTRVARHVPRRTGIALTIAAAVGTLTLSGCGVAGNQLHAGEAADVDGTSISTGRVDDVTSGYCSYLALPAQRAAREQQGAAGAYPRAYFKGQVLGLLVQEAAMSKLLAEHGLPEPPDLAAQAKAYRAQAFPEATSGAAARGTSAISRAFTFLNLASQALDQALAPAGADPATSPSADPTQASPSQQALDDWMADHDVEINPRYGISFENGGLVYTDDGVSVAVSDVARGDSADTFNSFATAAPTQEQQARIDALPPSQLCG